ncbi:MAG: hypothetical protein M1818_007148 [Claussenomyces sp. TS43310]|nr:MAG: hypothetical protein M1818_007148 [Claussenomyces sp. TS43310]
MKADMVSLERRLSAFQAILSNRVGSHQSIYPQFLLFGDSLLEFSSHLSDGFSFAAALQSRYIRRYDVINRGLSGYNTSQALAVLPKIIPDPAFVQVAYLLILFGANDACLQSSPTRQHVHLETFSRNLRALIDHPQVTAHKPRIILVTPPPIEETECEAVDAEKGYSLSRHVAVTAEYAQAVRDIGESAGDHVVVLDLWRTIMDEAVKQTDLDKTSPMLPGTRELGTNDYLKSIMPDGLHLNAVGYTIFLRELLDTLEKKWPKDTPEMQAFVLPNWRTATKSD